MNTDSQAHWSRPHWIAGENQAHLLYFAFGQFDRNHAITLPDFLKSRLYRQAELSHWQGHPLKGSLGLELKKSHPNWFVAAQQAPDMLRLEARIDDQPNLDYLRSTLRSSVRIFDLGAIVIIDPFTASIHDQQSFIKNMASGNTMTLRQHYLINQQAMDNTGLWRIYTRGLQKFARPDLEITHVPASQRDLAGKLCQQLADSLALGSQIKHQQSLSIADVGMLVAHYHQAAKLPFYGPHITLAWPQNQ